MPARHPILDVPLDEQTRAQEQLNRLEFKTVLQEAWRRESELDNESGPQENTHMLGFDTPILGDLPSLSARFDHVSRLELDGEESTTGVDGLLPCFNRLKTLVISKYRLGNIPQSVLTLPRLSSLSLTESAIRLTPASANALAGMRDLEFLDLSNNPLGIAPDVSQLHKLEELYLQDTGINTIPRGLFELPELTTLDLSDNLISEIPSDILELSRPLGAGCDLSGNPWSPQSLEWLREYFLLTGNNLGVSEASLDAQGNPLVPRLPPVPSEE